MKSFASLAAALLLSSALAEPGSAQSAVPGTMMSDEILDRLDLQGDLPPLVVAGADAAGETNAVALPSLGDEPEAVHAAKVMAAAMAEYVELPDAARVGLRIQFELNSALLLPAAAVQLTQLCTALRDRPDMQLRIFGHTDTSGPTSFNAQLSLARADAVKTYLTGPCGIAGDRLSTFGLGETVLLPDRAATDPEHRRVEFQLAG